MQDKNLLLAEKAQLLEELKRKEVEDAGGKVGINGTFRKAWQLLQQNLQPRPHARHHAERSVLPADIDRTPV